MALNVALPLSGLPESLFERCALISPIQQDFDDNLELLVTPYERSDSGIGSTDSKDTKSTSEDDETLSTSSSSSASSASSTSSSASPSPKKKLNETAPASADVKIQYQGRDLLDLANNLKASPWKFQYAELPENNVAMFMQNRSQYHRLGADGLNREYDVATCARCTFQFPVMSNGGTPEKKSPSVKMYKHF